MREEGSLCEPFLSNYRETAGWAKTVLYLHRPTPPLPIMHLGWGLHTGGVCCGLADPEAFVVTGVG